MASLPALILAASLAAAPAAFAQAPAAPPPAAEAIPTGPRAPNPAPPPAAAAPAAAAPAAPAAGLPPPAILGQAPPPPVATKSVVPEPVAARPLAAPDAFSTPARDTGLPATLWRGTSLQVVRNVLPELAEHPLSPAAAALARRVLGTGAQGPAGAGQDPVFVAGRAAALMTQGDPKGAGAILARAPGLDRDPELARVAAESALLAADDARACAIEEGLATGRTDIYWLRLRTYCQALAGKTTEAQLTFDLANSQAKDAVFARLMAAKLSGTKPGAASLRNGLDYALSRSLGLDLAQAKPSAAVAAALSAADPVDPVFDPTSLPADVADFGAAIASGKKVDFLPLPEGPTSPRNEAGLLLMAAYQGWPPATGLPTTREGRAPVLRDLALDAAAVQKRMGETALLVLWNCADAGPKGLALADRARIVWALRNVGLDADARNFALEGLAELK
jgi:hypothetical protein